MQNGICRGYSRHSVHRTTKTTTTSTTTNKQQIINNKNNKSNEEVESTKAGQCPGKERRRRHKRNHSFIKRGQHSESRYRNQTNLEQEIKSQNARNNNRMPYNRHSLHRRHYPDTNRFISLAKFSFLFILYASCCCFLFTTASQTTYVTAQEQQFEQRQQQQQQQQQQQFRQHEPRQTFQNNIRDENEIEFNSLDGATQLLPIPPPAGVGAATTTTDTFATRHNLTHKSQKPPKSSLSDITTQSPAIRRETSILTSSSLSASSYTELQGGEILSEKILYVKQSPYIARENIEIAIGARLTIEPGVTIEFAPTIGITVRGVLHAVGTPTSRITLTAQGYQQAAASKSNDLPDAEERGIRLVDGPSPLEGRLELYHKGSWRAVCTNSRNWTIIDYGVACRQMGYRGGRFWNWIERLPGYDPRLLYENPHCRGDERTLAECSAWQSRQLGSGVCDYHNDIGIQCLALHNENIPYWRGLHFDYAPTTKSLGRDNTVYSAMSQSTLKYVDILRAGAGYGYSVKSAIEVLGIPPVMQHVVVAHAAYTGINVTRPTSGFVMQNVTVRRSNGIGIFVNSSQGLALLDGCNIMDNNADGIKYSGHDLRGEERWDRATLYDFCTLPTTSGQTYPISLSFTQKYYAGSVKKCGKYFFTRPGYLLTVHFEQFVLKNNETTIVEIFDGASENDRLLFQWKARNYTRPQSVTSTREKLFIRIKAEMREEMMGYIRITSGDASAYDLRVADSSIEDNGGRGVAVDNIRSKLHVHSSSVSGNGHVSGVHVTSGAGDVNITNSIISFNKGAGLNITYYGGNRNISRSTITSNRGYGIAIWLNHTSSIDRMEFMPLNQTTVVEYSQIGSNIENGIRHGNFCASSWVNITANHFNGSLNDDVYIESCWRYTIDNEPNLRLQIGHNYFEYSQKNSIYMSPALNMIGKIEYNQFRYGVLGAIYIRNDYIFQEFNFMPVRILIQSNYFMRNQGIYVVSLGLSPYSRRELQSLLFTRNFVRENKVKEPFGPLIEGSEGTDGAGRLNPRSRVAAAIVVGSNHVDIYRNILHNLDSDYEIGSQLCDQSQIINATYNWLGYTDEKKIYSRLFHRNDRYNLAKIEYIPYLLHSSNPGSTTIITISTFVPRFFEESSNVIGGEVDGQEMIPKGTYTVTKDINIRPGGKLILQPGVILKFEPSVGMMVAGKLEAQGRHPDDIFFTLKRETIMVMDNGTMPDGEVEAIDMVETVTEHIGPPKIPVRLMGGAGDYEGRLQMYIDGRWGTVCDYGWTIFNAALVCHHLGYALNPNDWRLHRSEMPSVGVTEEVLVSNMRCTEHDHDIMKCRAEYLTRGDIENSCTHENDVGIRCYEGAWAGVRFSMLAERADLQYVTIEKAGLFDYTTNVFKPAIQMDFARHNLENVRVVDNLHDGLGVIYSDIYGGKSVNNVKNCEFTGNRGAGISLKQLDLRIQGSVIKSNRGSGITHDPVISASDQQELGGWFKMARDFNTFETDYEPFLLPNDESEHIDLGSLEHKYIRTEEVIGQSFKRKIIVSCPAGYVLGIQLLNPIQNLSSEYLTILDSKTENSRSDVWNVKRDLNVFPTTSSSYGIIIYYESGDNALGGAVLRLSTITAPVQNIRNRIVRGPVPSLNIRSTKIQKNHRGITALYYNRYIGDNGEYYLRKANESIKILNSEISYNKREAILIKSPFWDVIASNISEITIHVNSSMIKQNGHGIRQLSRDLRSSNNLFHYVIQDTTMEENAFGGFQAALPYVWQYNENFTHSIFFGNSTWNGNRKFFIDVRGHYAVFNITSNVFISNNCPRALISLDGMEKRLRFDYNRIESNNARFVMEFRADSLSEIIGEVPAMLAYNTIKDNFFEANSGSYYQAMPARMRESRVRKQNHLPTAVIRLDGVQNVKLYRNLISQNRMRYNLVAGVRSARLNNYFFASENWWGSKDIAEIEAKIFDFDNWNDHADVIFQPFLIEDSFDASISILAERIDNIDVETWTGGRIYKDLILRKRAEPYHILSDITVMPGVTLTIQHGVQMEFEPNVGILVLGSLVAIGYKESEIVMRPFKNATHEAYEAYDVSFIPPMTRRRRAIEDMRQPSQSMAEAFDSVRLCTTAQNCTTDAYSMINEGFLEYFNHTTLQWVPICDSRFTERNAQVVCRELGFDPLNVFYGHDRRIEYHTNSLTRIWTWVQPLECRGDEARMSDCAERLNGQVYGHRHECHWDDVFAFVSCNSPADEKVYWGGIRFANADFEENQYEHRMHDTSTHSLIRSKESRLEFITIEHAGILHGQKSAALQAIYKHPKLKSITIKNSAHHAINYIAPIGTVDMSLLNVSNSLGTGISILTLSGEGRESDESSFTPLKDLDMPYKLFSMIDICDPKKVLTVDERVLVYYKYDNNPVNCVKILTSSYRVKPIGFRLLQSNLFNHSKIYGRTDSLRLYDGDIYNVTSKFIDKIEWDTPNQRDFFKTTGPTLSIQLIASGAPETHGFIAEVLTVPISTIGQFRDALHNITYTHISGAMKGAISYASAGEVTPTFTISSNRIQDNCRQLYGNFSTCQAAVNFDVQNMHSLFFTNNLILNNQGGLRIRADSRGSATSLRGYIHHNLFFRNRNRPALYVEGRQSSPYQEIELYRNYFTQNKAGYDDVIRLRQVVSNFSYNYVHSNMGGRIVEVSGFEKVRLPIYQTTSHNGFYGNVATNWMGRATIVAGTAGQQYIDNVFENYENDYEMITVNNSIFSIDYRNSTIELWRSRIDARHNYWSYNNTISVQSRIRDKSDNPILLEVQAVPFLMSNETVLDGKCPPGFKLVHDTCFIYVGVPMSFHEARDFCRSENSSMPFLRTDSTTLWTFLQSQMQHMKFPEKVWIQDFNHIDRCTSFVYREVDIEDCNTEMGFICEIDPKVVIDPLSWRADLFAISIISAFILAIILLILVSVCWYAKSKHRHVQRLQRRNSIRQSLRSLNSIDPQGSLRRRNFNMSSTGTLTKSSLGQDYKKMVGNGSLDSMDKSVLSSEASYDAYENNVQQTASEYQQRPAQFNEYVNQNTLRTGSSEPQKIATIGSASKSTASRTRAAALTHDRQGNKNQFLTQNPNTFELSYRNEGFRDNSTYSGTRNNSVSTNVTEDTPIIHQTDAEDIGSDYYGNASTLPLHNGNADSLSFLSELKQTLPEYQNTQKLRTHSSFMPSNSNGSSSNNNRPGSQHSSNDSQSGNLPFAQKVDQMNFTPVLADQQKGSMNSIDEANLIRKHPNIRNAAPDTHPLNAAQLADLRRPDSYYTAVRSSKAQPQSQYRLPPATKAKLDQPPSRAAPNNNNHHHNSSTIATKRPKTVYQAAREIDLPTPPASPPGAYHRSKSEALLETDFDDPSNPNNMVPLNTQNRSQSQPLETAM